MSKTIDMKTESNTFTKRIGQTTYVVRFHYNENARETMLSLLWIQWYSP
ncbi:MAG: transposon-encoded TnpW family protein [Lachnospiraceae bacterium]